MVDLVSIQQNGGNHYQKGNQKIKTFVIYNFKVKSRIESLDLLQKETVIQLFS